MYSSSWSPHHTVIANVRNEESTVNTISGSDEGVLDLREFQLPAQFSNQSKLLQLPAELRTKILRYLHKSSDSLPCVRTFLKSGSNIQQSWAAYRSSVSLSGQTLRVCQQLHDEGSYVLLKENTLSLICDRDLRTMEDLHLWTLDAASPISNTFESMPNRGSDPVLWHRKSYAGDMLMSSLRCIQPRLRTVIKFETIELLIEYKYRENIFNACQALRPILQDKHVSVKLIRDPEVLGIPDEYDPSMVRCLSGLRCRSFAIEALNPENGSPIGKADVEELVNIVTSQEPVVDNSEDWTWFDGDTLFHLPEHSRRSFRTDQHHELIALHHAVMEYDGPQYARLKKEILAKARVWNQEAAEEEMKATRGQIEQLHNDLDRIEARRRALYRILRNHTRDDVDEQIQDIIHRRH